MFSRLKKIGARPRCIVLFAVYAVSDLLQARPHVYWKENARDRYLDELIRRDGRGDFAQDPQCPDCISRGDKEPASATYRCQDCFLPDLTCSKCFVRRHRLNPFHNVEVSFVLAKLSIFSVLCS